MQGPGAIRGLHIFASNGCAMANGFLCEDCEIAIWPTTTRSELVWLKDRVHVVREVAKHSHGGLEGWMTEGLEFLNDHAGHSVIVVTKR